MTNKRFLGAAALLAVARMTTLGRVAVTSVLAAGLWVGE